MEKIGSTAARTTAARTTAARTTAARTTAARLMNWVVERQLVS
jgi:response regulator of citrate/malate metabolism